MDVLVLTRIPNFRFLFFILFLIIKYPSLIAQETTRVLLVTGSKKPVTNKKRNLATQLASLLTQLSTHWIRPLLCNII